MAGERRLPGPGAVRWDVDRATLWIEVVGAVTPADARRLRAEILDAMVVGGARSVVCRASASAAPDLTVVDLLARLELAARAHGCTVRVVDSPRLRELLALAGLDAELALRSGVEPERQAEQREQPRGVEEEVQADDDAT